MADKFKEGISVKELENFARKYLTETFLVTAILIASISSMWDFFFRPMWSIGLAGLGAIVSIIFVNKMLNIEKNIFQFLAKQDRSVQIIIGVVRIILAIFLPFIIFIEIGILGGLAFHMIPKQLIIMEKEPKKEENSEEKE